MDLLKSKLGLVANNDNGSIEGEHERFKTECIGRTYLTSVVVGSLTLSATYFVQNVMTRNTRVRNIVMNKLNRCVLLDSTSLT